MKFATPHAPRPLETTMKLSVMDVIFCTKVVTGIINNLKSSLSLSHQNIDDVITLFDDVTKNHCRVGGLLKWRYTMTCMYYSSTNLWGYSESYSIQ